MARFIYYNELEYEDLPCSSTRSKRRESEERIEESKTEEICSEVQKICDGKGMDNNMITQGMAAMKSVCYGSGHHAECEPAPMDCWDWSSESDSSEGEVSHKENVEKQQKSAHEESKLFKPCSPNSNDSLGDTLRDESDSTITTTLDYDKNDDIRTKTEILTTRFPSDNEDEPIVTYSGKRKLVETKLTDYFGSFKRKYLVDGRDKSRQESGCIDSHAVNRTGSSLYGFEDESGVILMDYGDETRVAELLKAKRKRLKKRASSNSAELQETGSVYDKRYLRHVLEKHFKFNEFRKNQLESIQATLAGLDTLILMPTGAGKSICYQLPSLVTTGISIVISPLLALIRDQRRRLVELKLESRSLAGDIDAEERDGVVNELRQPTCKIKILFITPEGLIMSQQVQNIVATLYSRKQLSRFVVDEAHCVSTWGASFRPDYSRLGYIRSNFRDVPIMAMTATAAPRVRKDIIDILGIKGPNLRVFSQSYNRQNIVFGVVTKSKKCKTDLCNIILENFKEESGIVYCLTKIECDTIAREMVEVGIRAVAYHGGLRADEKTEAYENWLDGRSKVVCATIAFGMGIDKPDVRYVFHYVLPRCIEGYYQEAGRAGRDGLAAYSIIFYSRSDLPRMRAMIDKNKDQRKEYREMEHANLREAIEYCEERDECRRVKLLRHMGEAFDDIHCRTSYTICDNCLQRAQDTGKTDATDDPNEEPQMKREGVWNLMQQMIQTKSHR